MEKISTEKFNIFPNLKSLNVKNVMEIVEKIKDIKVSDDECLVSFDLFSLFLTKKYCGFGKIDYKKTKLKETLVKNILS